MLDLIQTALETAGFTVSGASSGGEGLKKLRNDLPDAVVLDVNLPDLSGFDVLREIREGATVPVIMLTVQNTESDRVHGLELGADDYLGKPFGHRELVSRIKAVLRRTEAAGASPHEVVKVDDELSVDLEQRHAIVRGETVRFRPTEFKLLAQLIRHPGRLQTHETLLSRVWGPEYRDDTQLLRLYINYLRKKLERDPAHPRYIVNERGMGYRFLDFKA
jgi:two-component system KDP operon response regulator KdpE